MRTFSLTLFLLIVSNLVLGQLSDIVDETWYLRYLRIDNIHHYVPFNEEIAMHFVELNPNYNATTNAIENSLSGEVTFDQANMSMVFNSLEISGLPCNEPNCYFENLYFFEFLTNPVLELREFTYSYNVWSSGQKTLRFTDEFGNRANFSSEPLQDLDEALFQTWYLHSMEADLGGEDFIVNFDPPINPSLTINPDLTFTGFGSCNDFSGNFLYSEDIYYSFFLFPENFQATNEICEFHGGFEDYYFSHFSSNERLYSTVYQNPTTGSAFFSFEMYPGYTFNFSNTPVLAVMDNEVPNYIISPNPVDRQLFIETNEIIKTMDVFDSFGKIVTNKSQPNSYVLDLSGLNTGIYFLRIESFNGTTIKKIIKK